MLFLGDQATLEWLYQFLYYLECSCKFCLTFLSLSFIVVSSLPVSTEIGTLKVFWSICLKKINKIDYLRRK